MEVQDSGFGMENSEIETRVGYNGSAWSLAGIVMPRDPTTQPEREMRSTVLLGPSLLIVVIGVANISIGPAEVMGAVSLPATCMACGKSIGADRLEVQHRGRRVHLHDGVCLGHWEKNRDVLFANLQARGALFDESAIPPATTSNAWLFFGLYVLIGLVCGAACAYVAISRGRPGLPWFTAGLILNVPILLFALVCPREQMLMLPDGIPPGLRKVPLTRAPVPCPNCRATNHPAADHCPGCGASLQPTATGEVGRI